MIPRPLVSVVLPMRDAAGTVERALRSVLDGTLRRIEVIVVDDGSTDDSAAVVAGISDPRMRLVRQAPRGVCAAADRATAEAQAPIVARMDADDFAYPTRLERQIDLLDRTGADLVGAQVRILDARGEAVESMRRYEDWSNSLIEPDRIRAMRFVELPVVNPTLMGRREVFEEGYRDGPWPEDYEFFLRALGEGRVAAKVAEVLLDWHDSEDRLTRTDPRYSRQGLDRCRRDHLLRGPLAGVQTVDLWGAGEGGKPWLRWLLAQGVAVRSVIDVSPRRIGQRIHGVPVIAPTGLLPPDGVPLIIAVGAQGARRTIEDRLRTSGRVPGRDAWFVC